MDKALLKEAKKYRVSTVKLATAQLPADQWETTSAKKWLEVIQKFLTDHNLTDAKMRVEIEGHDGYLQEVAIEEMVERTEEEIRKDIEYVRQREAAAKKEKQEAAKKKLASEKALYERLKKKFEKVKK